ncbi:MAG: hypothetical protein J0I47_05835 [Sphingomonas sp.]|uniref:hypothetical protein n=1 Tax=Sphingomonas sp. TaxID=28214 RepID=UPI001ACB7B94|nr:hypothetical protein [Sphingomonas sp.]MBN8807740.1 hypothetical protein [Sphingomonas sp.]
MTVIAALAACALALPALAKDKPPVFVGAAVVKDSPTVAFDKTKAYIMLRSDMPMSLYLMRIPSAEDQAAYDKLRADAFAKAHDKYVRKQASYERAVQDAKSGRNGQAGMVLPDKPVEPTEANFEFTPFGLMADVAMGPLNRFAKGDGGASTYLEAVAPGDYRVYGPLMVNPGQGVAGTCFCMGSVGFTAKAGEIVDLGIVRARENLPGRRPDGDSSAPMQVSDAAFFSAPSADMKPDMRVAALPVVPADFYAVGKLPNYYGVTISRMAPIPGVLEYDRDRIVDLRKR